MRSYVALILLFAIAIVWIIPNNWPTEPKFWLRYIQYLGMVKVPSLFDEFETGSNFLDGTLKVIDTILLPVRWLVFIGGQVYRTITFFGRYA